MRIVVAMDGIIGLVSPKVGDAKFGFDNIRSDVLSLDQLATKADDEVGVMAMAMVAVATSQHVVVVDDLLYSENNFKMYNSTLNYAD
ncbi:hypothetical protein NL676_023554 [Syzygium grande]|nr:hypothetical protein NL676_023554 [Syzygium grande]